jgi:MSHA biogenesis protein MshN
MSVINQVLNELEQRGAHTATDQSMVRAVLNSQRNFMMPMLVVGLVLVAGIVTWQWKQTHKPNAQFSGVATKIESTQITNEIESSQQSVAETAASPSDVITEVSPVKKVAPASRLSFELSSVPIPTRLPVPSAQPIQPTHPIQSVKPILLPSVISGVSPNPVVVTGVPKPLVISGHNFTKDSSVTLHSSDGRAYTRRPISSLSATQIVISPNFGKVADTWSVEIVDEHAVSSGQFTFTVQAPLAQASAVKDATKVSSLPIQSGTKMLPPIEAPAQKTIEGKVSSGESKPMKQVSAAQQADAEFRRAAGLMQQGRIADAIAGYETALHLDAGHDAARQALVALLLEGKRNAEAEKVLLDGLNKNPANSGHTILLARLQVERGALDQASATLEKSLPFSGTQPDYRAFLAALLQRQNRHDEAIKNYQIVVQAAPNSGVWLMGYGISLQAVQRNGEAKDVFQRALDTKTLNPELQAFVQQKLKAL